MATKTDTSKRTILKQLRLDSIALVAEGADALAQVVIAKAADYGDPAKPAPKMFDELNGAAEAQEKWNRSRWTLDDSVRSIMANATPEEKPKLLKATLAQFAAFAAAIIPELAGKVAKCADAIGATFDPAALDALLSEIADGEPLSKSAADAATTQENNDMKFDRSKITDAATLAELDRLEKAVADEKAAKDEAIAKAATAEAKAAEATTALAKAKGVIVADDPNSPEAISKALETAPAELVPVLKSMLNRLAEAETTAAASAEALAKEKAATRKKEAIAKVKAVGPVAGASEDALVSLVLATEGENATALDGILKAAARLAKDGTRERGSLGAESTDGVDPNDKLESLAKERAQREGISIVKARVLVATDPANQHLAQAALQAQGN